MAPRVVLGGKWWNDARRAAYESTDFHCLACGVSKYRVKGGRQILDAHEVYQTDYQAGRMVFVEAVPLCPYCHAYIHDGRLKMLLDKHEITQARYAAVIQHGDTVLAQAKLSKPTHNIREAAMKEAIVAGQVAEWAAWRLVVNGVEYPPLYKTFEEWKKGVAGA
jgi:hypothetical protein